MATPPVPAHVSSVPAEVALLVFDMEKYSQIPEAQMSAARCDVQDIVATALAECGLENPQDSPATCKDTGDGAILLFPASALARLVDPLLGRLNAALARREQVRFASAPAVRLRISLHVGPLSVSDQRGDVINEVCRLVDSDQARAALSAAKDTGAFLSAVLSETVYRRTVTAGRTAVLGQHHFFEADAHVSGKPGFQEPCRVHVPGLTAPAIRPYLIQEPSKDQQPASGAAPTPAARGGASFQFHAPVSDSAIAEHIESVRIDHRQR